MSRIRALVFDLDGTLLDRQQRLHTAHRELIALAERSGIIVLVATARYHGSAAMVLGDLARLADQGVFAGGPDVRHGPSGWTWRRSIPAATIDVLCSAIRLHLPHCRIGLASAAGALAYDPEVGPEVRAQWGVTSMPISTLAAARRQDALRLTVWSDTPDPRLAEVARELARLAGSVCRVIPADRGQAIYITAAEADKGTGALALLAHLGIDPAEAIACGDDLTDVPLIRAVGHGIAMADGHPELLAATPHRAAPAEEGGLLQAVGDLLRRS